MDVAGLLERTYRAEAGRIHAALIAHVGDFQLAEDSLQEAATRALETWPRTGFPDRPGAWLLAAARRRAIDKLRRGGTALRKEAEVVALERLVREERAAAALADPPPVPDERLRLVFTCCHPALALDARVALTLRTLGGLTTPQIARAFLVPQATMAQRLVRAKRKIVGAAIPYVLPSAEALPERLGAVLAVLYLVFNEGHSRPDGADLGAEALRLAQLVADLLPEEPEAAGLVHLMTLHEARRASRWDAEGVLVPLEEQDRRTWDREAIRRTGEALTHVLRRGRVGPYQLQAAVASLHAEAARPEDTDWVQIAGIYGVLRRLAPTPVVDLNHAAAVGMAQGPDAGLALLAPLEDALADYHLFHGARADLSRRAGRPDEARAAWRRALDCALTPSERAFYTRRLAASSA